MFIRFKQTILLIGDIILLYGSLILTLVVRYGKVNYFLINAHLIPFSFAFLLWLAIFYIVGLYDIRTLRRGYLLFEQILVSAFLSTASSIILFYSIPYFKISPKTNLVIFALVFVIIFALWRSVFGSISKTPQKRVLIIGSGKDVQELEKFLFENPQVGYKVSFQLQTIENITPQIIDDILPEHKITTVIIDQKTAPAESVFDSLYHHMGDIEIISLTTAYEVIMKKLPVADVKDFSLATSMSRSRGVYEALKRPLEFIAAIILFIILSPFMFLIWFVIKLTSRGPGVYSQIRVGKNEKNFTLYKFRTMRSDAEKSGPQWSGVNDMRVTFFGKLLRFTHFDELPQLINVIKGDLSFVGPRPERPEFVNSLKNQIPYYDIRHMIKPGITGWAQINFRYGSSIEDTMEKLRYDIFYIKNRSLGIDFLIILKTIKMFVFNYR
ncbi:MAG TPA: exopolysaccharide biosynthesis polyprenyl glycosylphosphotransferase [Candidatus Paceibacterota bacterium]|nr:exopolysaccharide biosynthesis polyprenyl glycosylphosphotransferase [Candidatus Paceibacterota bacterium]